VEVATFNGIFPFLLSFLQFDYFFPRRGCPRVLIFCTGFLLTKDYDFSYFFLVFVVVEKNKKCSELPEMVRTLIRKSFCRWERGPPLAAAELSYVCPTEYS
jgi:hypothetical protein